MQTAETTIHLPLSFRQVVTLIKTMDLEQKIKLQALLQKEIVTDKKHTTELKPMTMNEFDAMITQAEEDVKNGRTMDIDELKKEIEKW